MKGLTFFGDGVVEDIKSIGLVFGPNFFTSYFYADYNGEQPIAFKRSTSAERDQLGEMAVHTPIFAISFCSEWTLMPQTIFEEKDADTILNFNTKKGKTKSKWNRIIGLDAVIISEPDQVSAKAIEHVFPGLELRHGVGALLEYCRKATTNGIHVYLHEADGRFTLVIFDGKDLKFANSFDGKFDEDVRYFVLYSMKQLKIDPSTPFSFLGGAAVNTSVVDLLSPYLHQIVIPALDSSPMEYPKISKKLQSQYWVGLNAAKCAL